MPSPPHPELSELMMRYVALGQMLPEEAALENITEAELVLIEMAKVKSEIDALLTRRQ